MDMAKDNYLLQLLNNMQDSINSIDHKQDELGRKQEEQGNVLHSVHEQTKKTNGKVIKLRNDVDALQIPKTKEGFKVPPLSNSFLQIMALAVLIIVIIVAASLRVDLGGILG
jgi:hypothetical protein